MKTSKRVKELQYLLTGDNVARMSLLKISEDHLEEISWMMSGAIYRSEQKAGSRLNDLQALATTVCVAEAIVTLMDPLKRAIIDRYRDYAIPPLGGLRPMIEDTRHDASVMHTSRATKARKALLAVSRVRIQCRFLFGMNRRLKAYVSSSLQRFRRFYGN